VPRFGRPEALETGAVRRRLNSGSLLEEIIQ
jgi:hypothetical protein